MSPFQRLSAEKGHQASLTSAGRQKDGWLKSLPSEMSPEDSLPKAEFHRFLGLDERHHSFQERQEFREAI